MAGVNSKAGELNLSRDAVRALCDEIVTRSQQELLEQRTAMAMLLGAEWSQFLGMFVKYGKPENTYFDKHGVELNGQAAANTRYTAIRSQEEEADASGHRDAARRGVVEP